MSVKAGIVGTGWGVKVQVPEFRKAGFQVTALYSRDQARAEGVAKEKDIALAFSDVKALADSSEVDVVSIVTPPYLHLEQAKVVLESGKHLLLEKPLTVNGEEAEQLLKLVLSRPSQVAIVDHELRFTPALQFVKEKLQAGAIGNVLSADIFLVGPPPENTWTWKRDRSAGGGVLGAVGSHVIDLLRFVLGAEVAEVSAHLTTVLQALPDASGSVQSATADDHANLVLRLVPGAGSEGLPSWENPSAGTPKEVLALVALRQLGSGYTGKREFLFVGSQGSISFDPATSSAELSVGNKVVERVEGSENGFLGIGTRRLAEALQAALGPTGTLGALGPAATIADAVATQHAIDAAWLSSEKGGAWVTPKLVSSP